MLTLEDKFRDAVAKHGEEVADAYNTVVELSERYGIPFGAYLPRSFNEKFGETDSDNGVEIDLVVELCDVDEEVWQSSTFRCEVFRG